jgi:predicted O-methyltransferase YrrM
MNPEDRFQRCMNSTEFASDRREVLRKTSLQAAPLVEEMLDFVFIDGIHNYENVLTDIRLWAPKVKRGGYVVGDNAELGDVTHAVRDYAADKPITVAFKSYRDGDHCSWYWQVGDSYA